ncbi:M20/M25/M40 family metallo-hydrolase, partial [bacterium]|nr:M20/M25/M40 family metallo-hydrolase [bacterium]
VIAAHMDAGQMGMSMEPKGAERTTTFFKRYFNMQPPILFLLVTALTLTLAATVYWGLHGPTLIGQRLMIAAVIGDLVAVVIFTQMEFAGISPGANDNAAGVGVMLELARRLKDDPMEETEIWFLGVGSEETYMNGMAKFMDDRRPLLDKDSFYFLVPESCGFGRPRIVTGEGVYKTDYHDPALVGAAFLAAKRRGYPEVTPLVLRTGGTDATPPTVRGYKAVCILAMNENDYVPHYHWKTDLPEYIDTRALEKTSDIFEETIRIIDTEF